MTKYVNKGGFIFITLICNLVFGSILEFSNKPVALATAHTAVGGDVYSLYTNPAGLYGGRKFDLKIDLAAGWSFTGDILHNVNQIIDSAQKYEQIREAQQQGRPINITQLAAFFNGIKNLLDISQPGKGVIAQFNGGVGVKIKNFAFSVRNFTDIGLKPLIDDNFFLGSVNVSTPTSSAPNVVRSLFFSGNTSGGVVITTDTAPADPELIQARNKLKNNVVPWVINELEKLGVQIPQEVKNNPEGIANALINLAVQQNVSKQEIIDAVNLLAEREFQDFISGYLNRIHQQAQSFSDNNSGVIFRGINYTEIAFGYSHKFFDRLLIGGSLKYFIARTLYYHLKVFQEEEELEADFLRETISKRLAKTYTAFGLDLGAIYKLPIPVVETNVGLVIKNLIEPTFDIEDTREKIKIPRQAKLGVSGTLWKRITLGIDYDLNKVETLVPGYDVQNIAVGLQLDPPILPTLRLGYLRNLRQDNDFLYTAGLGIKILLLNIDIVGALRPEEVRMKEGSSPFPSSAVVGLTLGMRF
ncbi:MAG: conjugal transfer protein TraF [Endomicrobia bacterium]|nr:conjugal transfer protein TraF [Endomicrobiia bacterium]